MLNTQKHLSKWNIKHHFLVYFSHKTPFSCLKHSWDTENLSEIRTNTLIQHIKHTGHRNLWSQSYLKTWFHGLYSTQNTGIGNKTLSETDTQEYLNRQEE